MDVNTGTVRVSEAIQTGIVGAGKKFVFWLAVLISINAAHKYFTGGYDYDSTDHTDRRSGLSLHTDALTGCQYLTGRNGGITPRLNKNGQHICKGPQ